jgi:hypothetical protein
VIYSMFNILHIIMCYGHTNFAKFINHFFLRILSPIPNSFVTTIQLLSKRLLCFFAVDLR